MNTFKEKDIVYMVVRDYITYKYEIATYQVLNVHRNGTLRIFRVDKKSTQKNIGISPREVYTTPELAVEGFKQGLICNLHYIEDELAKINALIKGINDGRISITVSAG